MADRFIDSSLYYQSDHMSEQSVDQKRENAAAAIVVSSPYASTAS